MSEIAAASPSAPVVSATPAAVGTSVAPTTPSTTGTSTGTPVHKDPSLSTSKLADPGTPETKDTTAQKAAEKRKYKLKVDGAEQELELGDDEISVRLQKALAADKRMNEAADTRKAFAAFTEAFKSDPFSAAKEFGLDLDTLAEQRIVQRFQEEEQKKADPGAYERAQLQKQLDEYKSKETRAAEETQTRAQAEHDAKVGEEMERDFISALQEAQLPKDRRYLRMMAEIADVNLSHGIELTPKQMASEVRAQISETHKYVTQGLKGEALVSHLGDDVVREILRHSVEKHRAKQSAPTALSAPGEETQAQRDARKPKSGTEIRNFFRGLKDGR